MLSAARRTAASPHGTAMALLQDKVVSFVGQYPNDAIPRMALLQWLHTEWQSVDAQEVAVTQPPLQYMPPVMAAGEHLHRVRPCSRGRRTPATARHPHRVRPHAHARYSPPPSAWWFRLGRTCTPLPLTPGSAHAPPLSPQRPRLAAPTPASQASRQPPCPAASRRAPTTTTTRPPCPAPGGAARRPW
jgi:hypothetical protein